ncbi:putative ubiquitin conjugating enzyme [Aspergillus clavatus NRRL 1]|uniref:Ubiquitin conjugating enzyme, putative n=1 Tax=Aspergillus clavatus (strain ATCC 1007 / CBS 513.65 / DSM 816 / NCTC 3887 / NRRL 1 / QM 1276 / 107) TaxID=344612 RepID=A1CIW1_ASPCL|nr:ubiquitin conjugating enzyme, putative [Aspergillus clavatus NRRL 1]EAW10816.1 ubiquitin conjugating enzyme, putative [Aspergillus clavatus NRRL 1]
MSPKDFQRDLKETKSSNQFPHLDNVKAGDHEGSIVFAFCDSSTRVKIDFQAIVSDSHDYPHDHAYFVFTTSEDVPSRVTTALEDAQSLFLGLPIQDFLTYVDEIVRNALWDPAEESDQTQHFSDADAEDGFDAISDDWEVGSEAEPGVTMVPTTNEATLRRVLRRDLRVAKDAGLKVSYHGPPTWFFIVSLSCRAARLGIPEEAMSAWDIRPSQYIVLLIRYSAGYLDLESVLSLEGRGNSLVQFRVGICSSYKPSHKFALQAFDLEPSTNEEEAGLGQRLKPIFIEKPLNSLLNDRFLRIVKARFDYGFSWTGAELYTHESQGKMFHAEESLPEEYFEPDSWGSGPASVLLLFDHMRDETASSQLSLPLVAMQFMLRHLVKCTEFCLVCHCKIADSKSYEAIKPYVCSNGLCLYQYMALGMATNLEYEIKTQPDVVDLLVSLTYARAGSGRLEDFPTGLGLRVPAVLNFSRLDELEALLRAEDTGQPRRCYSGTLRVKEMICTLDQTSSLKEGDWATIFANGTQQAEGLWHCRIARLTSDLRQLQFSLPIIQGQQRPASDYLPRPSHEVKFVVYDKNFDDLSDTEKRRAVQMLLGTLPSIEAMNIFLAKHPENKGLAAWKDAISPGALDMLRWVVASNRSFIKKDNDDNLEHRVSGMDSYIQFRLVQGAPDKEQRFINAVNAKAAKSNHPTLFAWHGSPIQNWHSILREGLHFKEVSHGRAYGDGVYLSNNFKISAGYAAEYNHLSWPQSRLGIQACISLNEVVNVPAEFKSRSPHYVVPQLDWIQPRYLFAKCRHLSAGCDAVVRPSFVYKQDSNYPVYGPCGELIEIPMSAFSSQRRRSLMALMDAKAGDTKSFPLAPAGHKQGLCDPPSTPPVANTALIEQEDDNISQATTFEDMQLLLSDTEDDLRDKMTEPSQPCKSCIESNFDPGTLDKYSFRLLTPPEYATTPATRILQQHLQATLKVQARENIHDLGWYIDPDLINTVYQWVVELHSFDPALPLAKDLKAANLKSVLIELRFPPRFPMAPPFVRIIRPRFLEFAAGGGGHVTAGGAMCMELLTNSGWLPTASIESVLLQVRMALTNTDPRPARLAGTHSRMDYGVGEAVEAYKRACIAHGWQIPEDIQQLSWG